MDPLTWGDVAWATIAYWVKGSERERAPIFVSSDGAPLLL